MFLGKCMSHAYCDCSTAPTALAPWDNKKYPSVDFEVCVVAPVFCSSCFTQLPNYQKLSAICWQGHLGSLIKHDQMLNWDCCIGLREREIVRLLSTMAAAGAPAGPAHMVISSSSTTSMNGVSAIQATPNHFNVCYANTVLYAKAWKSEFKLKLDIWI